MLLGAQRRSLIAQLTVHDAPLPIAPLDLLALMLHRLLRPASERCTEAYVRLAHGPDLAGALARVEIATMADPLGQRLEVRILVAKGSEPMNISEQ
jgi:hypothetical protein